jgi:hypothetical protein
MDVLGLAVAGTPGAGKWAPVLGVTGNVSRTLGNIGWFGPWPGLWANTVDWLDSSSAASNAGLDTDRLRFFISPLLRYPSRLEQLNRMRDPAEKSRSQFGKPETRSLAGVVV